MSLEQLKEQLELSKTGFSALKKVIAFSCSRCGLCASLCPTGAIEMQETIPTLVGECTKCGFCYQGCPRSFYPVSGVICLFLIFPLLLRRIWARINPAFLSDSVCAII